MIIFCCVVIIIIAIVQLIKSIKYREMLRKKNSSGATIRFEQFKNMYPVAPDAWDFSPLKDEEYVIYFPLDKERKRRCSWEKEYFYFKTFHDYKKAIRFIKKIKSDEWKLQILKKDAEIAGWFQTDINIYREKYSQEMSEQNKKIKDAVEKFLTSQSNNNGDE